MEVIFGHDSVVRGGDDLTTYNIDYWFHFFKSEQEYKVLENPLEGIGVGH